MSTNKGLKEWNAVIEALGTGKQTILIRKYPTSAKEFVLYPTFSYALKDDYLEKFKKDYKPFVQKNALPKKSEDKTEIKYYAKCENIIEKPSATISKLDKYHIWYKDHVKSYLQGKKGYLWVLRVYELETPYWAEPNHGMLYSNLKKEVSTKNATPILTDNEFSEIIKEIK